MAATHLLDEGLDARLVRQGGGFAFSKGHEVSGIKADPFLYNALSEGAEQVDKIFKRLTDGL